jgi:hypothetical protein
MKGDCVHLRQGTRRKKQRRNYDPWITLKNIFYKFKFKYVYRNRGKSNRKYVDCIELLTSGFFLNKNIFFISQGGMDAHTA